MEPKALLTYRCHKRVQAVKIKDVNLHDPTVSDPPVEFSGGFIIHDLPTPGPIPFDADFWHKHQPKAGDYLVIYEDGYCSISPGKAFEEGYTLESSGLNFGLALEALKQGRRIARRGWNGKGMWLSISCNGTREVPAENFWSPHNAQHARDNGGTATVLPTITMKTATGEILMGWLASQTDMLSDDWEILD